MTICKLKLSHWLQCCRIQCPFEARAAIAAEYEPHAEPFASSALQVNSE
jgi:hypothetical protein